MNFELRLEKECPSDWNTQILKSPMGSIFNTFEYSQYAQRRLGWQPSFLYMMGKSGEIAAQVVIFEYARNRLKKVPRSFSKIVSMVSKTIKWIYGPVIFSNEEQQIVAEFLLFVQSKANRLDGSIHPFFNGSVNMEKTRIEKWSTFLIDLQQTKNSIISGFDKHSAKKNIERAEERGVQISEIKENNISQYHDILNEFRITSGNEPFEYEDTYDLWKLLGKIGFKGFLATKDGKNIGGITFSFFNNYINEWGIARSSLDTTKKLYSQDLLKWKIIEWGIENKQRFYDLSGFNPNPVSGKEEGILRYKKKWGGKQYDYWLVRK
jgi:hypothetical protein